MNRNESRKLLKDLYLKMEMLQIPTSSSQNEALGNLIENLLELDAYYAGLALSGAEGDKISPEKLYDLNSLYASLTSIQANNQEDKKTLEACKLYLNVVYQIDCLLRN